MNRRKFFTTLAAVVAAPKLLKPRPAWVLNPAWVVAEYRMHFPDGRYMVPIMYRREVNRERV